MKKSILLLNILFFSFAAIAQTDGLSYQAVIIDNQPQEVPGIDVTGNYLSNGTVNLRFTIYNGQGTIIYQEIQETTTDPFGMINVVIGSGEMTSESPIFFDQIEWDGSTRDLGVELSYSDNNFEELSRQTLYFLPYAFHRNITATGTLIVDGSTTLNDELTVEGDAEFMSHSQFNTITVMNESDLQGSLNVGGHTHLHSNLAVDQSALVTEDITIGNDLIVGNNSYLNGTVKVTGNLPDGIQYNFSDYPLQVEGGAHGIGVKVNGNQPGRNTNFITFFDGNNEAQGRIEGFYTQGEVAANIIDDIISGAGDDSEHIDPDDDSAGPPPPADLPASLVQELNNNYTFGQIDELLDVANSSFQFGVNLAAATLLCVGGDCDDVIWSGVDLVVQLIQYSSYVTYNAINLGVAFESGGADYAEWLQKENPNERMTFGDVVGVKGGKISKNYLNAEKFLIVSQNPSVIGAMPEMMEEFQFEKIAFMGQVPVKTIGTVQLGDYILPSGNSDGMAMAVSPENMKAKDYKRIIGVAWSAANGDDIFTYINTAVGLNSNDMSNVIDQMQVVMNNMQTAIQASNPDYVPFYFNTESTLNGADVDYSRAASIQSSVIDQLDIKSTDNLQDKIDLVKKYAHDRNVDLSRFPYVLELLENPGDKEIQEKLMSHYLKVSDNLMGLKNRIQEYRNDLRVGN